MAVPNVPAKKILKWDVNLVEIFVKVTDRPPHPYTFAFTQIALSAVYSFNNIFPQGVLFGFEAPPPLGEKRQILGTKTSNAKPPIIKTV